MGEVRGGVGEGDEELRVEDCQRVVHGERLSGNSELLQTVRVTGEERPLWRKVNEAKSLGGDFWLVFYLKTHHEKVHECWNAARVLGLSRRGLQTAVYHAIGRMVSASTRPFAAVSNAWHLVDGDYLCFDDIGHGPPSPPSPEGALSAARAQRQNSAVKHVSLSIRPVSDMSARISCHSTHLLKRLYRITHALLTH